ncbi:MAG: type II toxin-antitoxin system Phd/YefM family antitoxin [Gammaproteobacteria bacterium]
MKTANIAEAKARFSALLAEVEAGEEVIITRRGKPVARMFRNPLRRHRCSISRHYGLSCRRSLAARACPWPTCANKNCCDLSRHLGTRRAVFSRADRTCHPGRSRKPHEQENTRTRQAPH